MADAKKTVTLRDLDVRFESGGEQTLTLWPADKLDLLITGDIVVQFHERSNELIRMHGRHIEWYSLREREQKLPEEPLHAPMPPEGKPS